jgi:hypothetical protein
MQNTCFYYLPASECPHNDPGHHILSHMPYILTDNLSSRLLYSAAVVLHTSENNRRNTTLLKKVTRYPRRDSNPEPPDARCIEV